MYGVFGTEAAPVAVSCACRHGLKMRLRSRPIAGTCHAFDTFFACARTRIIRHDLTA